MPTRNDAMPASLTIDVYVDLICPWCLIGKRNLDIALAVLARTQPETVVQVNWHSVQLIPAVPAEGWPFAAFYQQRLGGAAAVRQRQQQVEQAAAQAGLSLQLANIPLFPNTARAHGLLDFAREHATPAQLDALIERLFNAYFINGENIGDVDTLLRLAQQCGVDAGAIAGALQATDLERPAVNLAHCHGGVPCFVFNGRSVVDGARSAEHLLRTMLTALSTDTVPAGEAAR